MKYYLYKVNKEEISVSEELHERIQTILNAGQHSLISLDNGERGIYTGNIKSWKIDVESTRLDESHQIEAPKQDGETKFQEALKSGKDALYDRLGWDKKSK